MATEDFTTFEITADEDSDLTIIASRITWSSMRLDATTYTGTDKGAGHFGDFEHDFTQYNVGNQQAFSRAMYWGIGNIATGSIDDLMDDDDGLMYYFYYDNTPSPDHDEYYFYNANGDESDSYAVDTANHTYYTTIERTSAPESLTAKIYSDESRETLVDTLTLTYTSDTYRYLWAGCGGDWAEYQSWSCSGYVENLDLNEVAAGWVAGGKVKNII